MRIPPRLMFVDIFGAVMDPFNRQGKAIPNADLEDWMALFRDKLDEKTYNLIFQTLTANQFTSRLQLKLLTPEQVDMMFAKELSLGAKTLLIYQLDLLNDASPLPPRSRKERRVAVLSDEGGETKSTPETRRVSFHVLR